jgi:hypothetical protein
MARRRLAFCIALAGAAVAAPLAAAAGGPFYFSPPHTRECTNVKNCEATLGPWVVVPARGEASFLVACPALRGYLIAGTDARASSSSVRVWFDGQLGAPGGLPPSTAPGGAALLVHAVSMNGRAGSFQPIIGCVSLIDKTKTATYGMRLAGAVPGVAPAAAIDFHSRTIPIGTQSLDRLVLRCPTNEKLIGSWSGFAFDTLGPPPRSYLDAGKVTTSIVGKSVVGRIFAQQSLFVPMAPLAKAQFGAMCEA